jgi:hypothetical protein
LESAARSRGQLLEWIGGLFSAPEGASRRCALKGLACELRGR